MIKSGRLRWEIEWACDACGISHHGAWGAAPAEVRSKILAQHGPYCVRLVDGEHGGGGILKAFRGAFSLSIQESRESALKLKQCGYQGTYVETLLLSQLLQGEGIHSEVLPGACE